MVGGRRIKLRYAHLGGHNPPVIVIHGNQTSSLPKSYQRYLENVFRNVYKLEGTPLQVEFKQNANPYEGKKNPVVKNKAKLMREKNAFSGLSVPRKTIKAGNMHFINWQSLSCYVLNYLYCYECQ